MNRAQAETIRARHLKAGRDHVVPYDLQIIHPELGTEIVPAGFVFDGSTVVWDTLLGASARHDWLYATGEVCGHPITRKYADEVYRDTHYRNGMNFIGWERYWGLRMVGGVAWAGYRKKDGKALVISRTLSGQWSFPQNSWMLKHAVWKGED
jgi:hypothetical protein